MRDLFRRLIDHGKICDRRPDRESQNSQWSRSRSSIAAPRSNGKSAHKADGLNLHPSCCRISKVFRVEITKRPASVATVWGEVTKGFVNAAIVLTLSFVNYCISMWRWTYMLEVIVIRWSRSKPANGSGCTSQRSRPHRCSGIISQAHRPDPRLPR